MNDQVVIMAVDVNDAVPEDVREKVKASITFTAGLAGLLQGDALHVPAEAVAHVLRELDPDRWVPTNVPGIFSVRDGAGRPFLAWQLSGGGWVIGFAGEINLAVFAEAAVQVLIPSRKTLVQ